MLPSGSNLTRPEATADGHQWGTVVEGEVALIIDGKTRRYERGESYDIPAGVVHAVKVRTGTVAVNVVCRAGLQSAENPWTGEATTACRQLEQPAVN